MKRLDAALESSSTFCTMTPALLTAHDATDHVHLIVGSNPLASARCSKSLEVGAKPIVIAPYGTPVHYALQKRVDDGLVRFIEKEVEDADLQRLGRDEVDKVVDAVFVTLGNGHPLSEFETLRYHMEAC